jgi:hypothetical protein
MGEVAAGEAAVTDEAEVAGHIDQVPPIPKVQKGSLHKTKERRNMLRMQRREILLYSISRSPIKVDKTWRSLSKNVL